MHTRRRDRQLVNLFEKYNAGPESTSIYLSSGPSRNFPKESHATFLRSFLILKRPNPGDKRTQPIAGGPTTVTTSLIQFLPLCSQLPLHISLVSFLEEHIQKKTAIFVLFPGMEPTPTIRSNVFPQSLNSFIDILFLLYTITTPPPLLLLPDAPYLSTVHMLLSQVRRTRPPGSSFLELMIGHSLRVR